MSEVERLLVEWRDAAVRENIEAALEPFRKAFSLIGCGEEPDWQKVGVLRSSFFGWGLQHSPERKGMSDDKFSVSLETALGKMDKAGLGLANATSRYANYNDTVAGRKSTPPHVPRCPKCRVRISENFDSHVRHCRPWNMSTNEELSDINRENELIRNPPPITPQATSQAFNSGSEYYGACVTDLGRIQARLVQGPPEREIRTLTMRARRLLDLIDTASTGL